MGKQKSLQKKQGQHGNQKNSKDYIFLYNRMVFHYTHMHSGTPSFHYQFIC